jgi:hypothetical protein
MEYFGMWHRIVLPELNEKYILLRWRSFVGKQEIVCR